MHQLHVFDVVVDELLVVFLVQGIQVTVFFIGEFTFTQYHVCNIIQSIGFLLTQCVQGKLLEYLKVVEMLDTLNNKVLIRFTVDSNVPILHQTPRTEATGHLSVTSDLVHTVDQIGDIEEPCVPPSNNVRSVCLPEPDELLQ